MLSFEQKKILFVSDGLVSFSIALLVGVISILFFKFSWIIFFLSFGLGMALLGGFYENRHIYPYVIFFLSLPFFLLIFSKKTDFSFIEGISGTAFSQEVVISGSSVKENSTQRVPFVFQYCDRGDCFQEEAFLRTQLWENYQQGEHVYVSCNWEIPEYDKETQMDWKRIFASRGPVLFCYDYNPRKTGERTITWQSRLADMRSDWESRLEKILPFPESALGSGLLFGGTSRFSKEWEEKFNNTSMTHIVAVSGYNVTLLVQYFSLIAIAIGIRRQHSWWIGVLGIFFFLALIGFPASGVRAGIMGILVLFAVRGGVIGSGTRALLLASAMMVFDNPFILRYDVGFQLSVLATAGILLGIPIIVTKWNKQKFPWIVEIFIEIFLTTLAAQLFVLPLILGTFGSFSFLSLFANILILWNIPLVMFFLFFALVVSSFSFFLAKLFGLGASLILSYNLFVIDSISSFSFFSISSFSMDFSYMYYGAILFVLFWYYVKNRRKKYLQCELYEAGEK